LGSQRLNKNDMLISRRTGCCIYVIRQLMSPYESPLSLEGEG